MAKLDLELPIRTPKTDRVPSYSLAPGSLCRLGAWAAFLFLAYSLATVVQFAVLGGPPASAAEAFAILQRSRVVGLIRLDLPTVLALPLYYLLFLALFTALRAVRPASTLLSTCLAFVGVTLCLATPTAFSMLALSDRYAAATSEAMRTQWLTVGEAVMATDIWHSTAALLGGFLLQTGAVMICVAMLNSGVFRKPTAYLGIAAHGLDLAHIVFGLFWPAAGVVLMSVAGPLYPVWFFLVGRRLLRLAAETRACAVKMPRS